MNSRTKTSQRYSTLPGSDVPWLIARACSGDWPYQPEWLEHLRHPSISARFSRESQNLSIPDFQDRTVRTGVELVRKEARRILGIREVRHFEVTHRVNRSGNTEMGWVAVVRVKLEA